MSTLNRPLFGMCMQGKTFPARFAPTPYPMHLPAVAEAMESSFIGCFAASDSLNPVVYA